MSPLTPACPLCGSVQSRIFDRRKFRNQDVTNRICNHCGLVYQSPRMSESELAEFYQQEYRQLYQGDEGPNPKDLAVQRGRANFLAKFTQSQIASAGRHLDIGCSAGLLLQRFQVELNCASVGIEPGQAYRAYARQQGLVVYPSLDALVEAQEPPFDLISMAHVLEHIGNPIEYLTVLRQTHLNPEGWLLIEVPNLYAHDSFEVAHLVSYSPHTLTQVLRQAGFQIASLKQHGQPRSEIIQLYLTALARPAQDELPFQLEPEANVERRRRLGLLHRHLLTRISPNKAWIPIKLPED
jgi:2-polyprenyl-3-methyl-5-hydroxy-6-metoxy-1,4-benzoquinol methylase